MNVRNVFNIVSLLLIVIAIGMAVSWLVSVGYDDPPASQQALLWSAVGTFAISLALRITTRGEVELSWRDGIGVTTFGWLSVCLVGALPYVLSQTIAHPVAAVFESVSGFTTTGASVVADVEAMPKGILFWRSLTHFFGGMGVLVLVVAVLPFLGVGGMQLYKAEVTGPSKDRLTPRITTTAKLLWGVYVLLCVLLTLLLRAGGVSWFDSICHAFGTIATGGFSTKNRSIASFESRYVEIVIAVFMFLGAVNFALHYRALKGRFTYFRNSEFRFFLGLLLGAWLLSAFNTWKTAYATFPQSIANTFFSVVSLATTTGFSTDDFNLWPSSSRIILLLLMIMGGSVGSTAGAIKQMRVLVVLKKILTQIKLFMHPQAVLQVKMGKEKITDDAVSSISIFFILYIAVLAFMSLAMTLFVPDIITATSAVIATVGGVGPGLNSVGPASNYAAVPSIGKIILIFGMLLGRLEFYVILALFFPRFWKK